MAHVRNRMNPHERNPMNSQTRSDGMSEREADYDGPRRTIPLSQHQAELTRVRDIWDATVQNLQAELQRERERANIAENALASLRSQEEP
jgi:hypothetical protein